ncbi:MAG: hypothetical protein JWN46_1636, partial [Acidimicrobiales bacterium]|nr:hypothetical protein [Acidimicrobiales bacterium]
TTTSGGSAIPVKEWADGFCIPLGVWIKDLKAASAKVKTAPQTTIAEKKTAIEGLFDEAAAASEKLAGVIEALPPADMKQGDQIGPDLVTKFNDFTTESKATKDKVAAASDTDQVAFKAAATDAINAFQANVKVISDSFSALDTKYPDAAFQTAFKASCAGPLSGA